MTAHRYRPSLRARLADLWHLALATATRRSFAWLFARLHRAGPVEVRGLDALPPCDAFVLALNHLHDGASGALVVAALDAVARARPDALARVLLVGGRAPARRSRAAVWGRAFMRWMVGRWRQHFVVISMEGAAADWGGLRTWREAAAARVSVVFPEGIAGDRLQAMRPGVGRWLAALPVPTVPCAVWFDGARWCVHLGAVMAWSPLPSMRDVQLGLALAALLPDALQGRWRDDLARWRSVRSAAGLEEPSCPQADSPRDP